MSDVELRFSPPDAELRFVSVTGKPGKIVGYAAVFNSLSHELGDERRRFKEVVRRGAFRQSLADRDDVLARGEHQALLGRTSSGTLRLFEDSRGLRFELDIPDTSTGRDYRELVSRGDIKGSSFAFKVRKPGGENWRNESQGRIRELLDVMLIDVAPVSRPAYPSTEIALRSLAEWQARSGATRTDSERKQLIANVERRLREREKRERRRAMSPRQRLAEAERRGRELKINSMTDAELRQWRNLQNSFQYSKVH